MTDTQGSVSLDRIFDGWEGYNTALVRAIQPRSLEELEWRPAPSMRSVGEVAAHIALGRIDWFSRMGAPAAEEPARRVQHLATHADEYAVLVTDAAGLVRWLNLSWAMIDATLKAWTVGDLWESFRQPYGGKVYSIPRQWVLFRMLIHDVQHGGQLSVMLGQQGVELPDLGYLGGHLTEPPVAEDPALGG